MQAYVDRGLTFFAALLGLFAAFVQFQQTLQGTVMLLIFVALGFLCGCIVFSLARFARYGMTVAAVTNAPLRIKAWPAPSTLLGQLESCIGEWAERDIEAAAMEERRWKLWRFCVPDWQDSNKIASCVRIHVDNRSHHPLSVSIWFPLSRKLGLFALHIVVEVAPRFLFASSRLRTAPHSHVGASAPQHAHTTKTRR